MLNPGWYEGREQALVKHTFLDTYMPAQIPKIVRWAGEFTYVDLFSGPWQSKSGDYSDTSFGIALRRMTEAKATQAKLGRKVRMVAHLVEKDTHNFAALTEAVKRFPEVETFCYSGVAEQHAATIASLIPKEAFRFVVIDPKGVPDVRTFKCLIQPDKTEVLLNFMFQFANRFASSQDRMPPLEGWLGGLSDEEGGWRRDFLMLKGAEREAAITDRARQALRKMGNYAYAPALTVDETAAERPLYKLIFLSRHPIGLLVFRDAHVKALETQATYKSVRRQEARRQQSGMDDLFADPTAINPGERSALEISDGLNAGREKVLELLAQKPEGLQWKTVWPAVLDACVVTYNQIGDCVRELREAAQIEVPDWTSSAIKRPKDDYWILPGR
ncbi:three-Cys-motif partner protein TcmP [Sphingobium soli]|uniref:Three-Cys-motif partner protein TcmP n=1 Tax=Sphingobium soli TaxID=1591116 RepID=A0ABS8H502_9SPHN|nr:three-Cys-motif partner protein TcmP [Sphingobium soli]MCC4233509.1 three-Cys-motif partner protein TcmP [Sphingobium soli]